MAVREASTDDIGSIRAVAEASWREDYPEILSRESVLDGFDEWYGVDRLETALESPKTLVFVAADANTICGFVHAVVDGDSGILLRLYVHPDHRTEGMGSTLFEHARTRLSEYSLDTIRGMVLAENTIGNEFYRGLGFEKVSSDTTRIGGETFAENTYELQL